MSTEKTQDDGTVRLSLPILLSLLSLLASPVSAFVTLKVVEDRQVRQQQDTVELASRVTDIEKDNKTRDIFVNGLSITLNSMNESLKSLAEDMKTVKQVTVINANGRQR